MKLILALALCLAAASGAQSQTQLKPPTESAMDRFLRYVKIDTQSAEDQTTVPSTRKQLNLANLLAKELTTLGAEAVRVSEFGIVYAMIPGIFLPIRKFSGWVPRTHRYLARSFGRKRPRDHP
jgi:hypothetical protein